jgi:hydrogenase maturation protein HypF
MTYTTILIKGIVQGVGFRPFIYRIATKHRLTGYVQNRGDAGVKVVLEGKKLQITKFLKSLEIETPPQAKIHEIIVDFDERKKKSYTKFKIIKSDKKGKSFGSIIPPDISICDECLEELRDPRDRRYDYFFITCTNCGPRYTIINDTPYDRENTTMKDFNICKNCREDYVDPKDRRFHAQTIVCSYCGPQVLLCDRKGEKIELIDPIREAGKLLEEGFIVAIKGNGGFHIAASTLKDEPVIKLRKSKHRSQKPFAIMARSVEAIRTFAELNAYEESLLTSPIRPIILLKKNPNYCLSNSISPNLHNIGIMLPYTGQHYLLFEKTSDPAFIMTSANPPEEPIITENDVAIKKLSSDVDYFLMHDRTISQRCDDSVVRFVGESMAIIRRSRGFAPAPIHIQNEAKRGILGVGGELNVTCCILKNRKAFISQHIGDVETIETLKFLSDVIKHLIRLTKSDLEIIAHDLHPRFNTTKLARDLAEELGCEHFPVQHHFAHLAKIMGEHNLQEAIGIVCDGYGYGLDGKAWGGEILFYSDGEFKRIGHLEEQPMIGGDLATKFPLRMLAGFFKENKKFDKWLLSKSQFLPYGEEEANLILQQSKLKNTMTTSCGRLLDAISALLGICYERTYEGEPAMKLESVALNGKIVLNLKPKIERDVIKTNSFVEEIFHNLKKYPIQNLAYSAQSYIADSLAEFAILEAERLGVRNIGFTGGVAYNEHIALRIKKMVEKNGFNFFLQCKLPPGDGGISFGQTIFTDLVKEK